jgi:hypothetical protein
MCRDLARGVDNAYALPADRIQLLAARNDADLDTRNASEAPGDQTADSPGSIDTHLHRATSSEMRFSASR